MVELTPALRRIIDGRRAAYDQRINAATGQVRAQLEEMINVARATETAITRMTADEQDTEDSE
jgi:hypothetical protein